MPNLHIINFKGGQDYNIVESVNISQHFKLLEKYCPDQVDDNYLHYNLKKDYKLTQTLINTDETINFLTLIDTKFGTEKIKDGDKLYHVDAHLNKERHHGAPILVPKTTLASSRKSPSRPTPDLRVMAASNQFTGAAIESGKKASKSPSQNFGDSRLSDSVFDVAPLYDLHVDLGHHRKS